MNRTTLLMVILTMTTPLFVAGQSVLGPGDSRAWQFEFRYESTLEVNSEEPSFGGHIILDYTDVGAGPLDYRLDFFEDVTSQEPILTLPVRHLTGLRDHTGMPLIWIPEFTSPPEAWVDLDGVLRLTIESGQMRDLIPHVTMLLPGSAGLVDYYRAVLIPEPATLLLMAVGGLLALRRIRNR